MDNSFLLIRRALCILLWRMDLLHRPVLPAGTDQKEFLVISAALMNVLYLLGLYELPLAMQHRD